MSPEETTISALAITASVSAIGQFLPHISEVRHTAPNSSMLQDVRLGEIAAVGISLGIGGATAMMLGRHEPFVFAVAAATFLVLIYEYAVRCQGE